MSKTQIMEKLAAYLEELVSADRFSGAVLVAKDDTKLFQHAYGLAEKNFQVPAQLETKYNLGSLNKMFTAVAILQLVEQGKVSLHEPISRYLPDYPRERAERITLHHLLTHTSGLGSYWNEAFKRQRMQLRTVQDFLALFIDDALLFAPGERWAYSNAGYIVLGAIIEAVSGHDYFTYVRQRIYHPAQMYETDAYELDQTVPHLAVGYTYMGKPTTEEPQQQRNNLLLHSVKGGPAGGGYSTVLDLYQFSRALRSHVLLSSASTQVLLSGKVERPDVPGRKYAYGFGEREINGKRIVGHGGGFPGISSHFEFTPENGYTVVVLSNYDPPITTEVTDAIWRMIDQSEEGVDRDHST
jgi:CubicO group peptidase (beta-lactamase class C family)